MSATTNEQFMFMFYERFQTSHCFHSKYYELATAMHQAKLNIWIKNSKQNTFPDTYFLLYRACLFYLDALIWNKNNSLEDIFLWMAKNFFFQGTTVGRKMTSTFWYNWKWIIRYKQLDLFLSKDAINAKNILSYKNKNIKEFHMPAHVQ